MDFKTVDNIFHDLNDKENSVIFKFRTITSHAYTEEFESSR